MKLSKDTIAIMKNFGSINGNLLLSEGSVLSTKSAKKTVVASVTVPEVFPIEFGVYDLNEFLGALSLSCFADPDLEFNNKYVTIKENSDEVRYYAAEKDVLSYLDKTIVFPSSYVDFTMSATVLANIQKTANILRGDILSIVGDGTSLFLEVGKQKMNANSYRHEFGTTDKVFRVNVRVEYLRMLPGEYHVSISDKKLTKFQSTSSDLVYYIAVEKDSVFGG